MIEFVGIISQLSPFTIGVIMVFLSMRLVRHFSDKAMETVKDTQDKSAEIQEKVLGVLNKQMANENNRDRREDAQLEENKRHHYVMEETLNTMAVLIGNISSESTNIKHAVGLVLDNQKTLQSGVDAMTERDDKKILELLETIIAMLTPPATLPEEQKQDATRPIVNPGPTKAQEKGLPFVEDEPETGDETTLLINPRLDSPVDKSGNKD